MLYAILSSMLWNSLLTQAYSMLYDMPNEMLYEMLWKLWINSCLPLLSLFGQVGSLFFARRGPFFASLYICKSPAILLKLCSARTQRMADTYSSVQRRYILFHSALSSCWQAELQRLVRAASMSVMGSNPCLWPFPGWNSKDKFKTQAMLQYVVLSTQSWTLTRILGQHRRRAMMALMGESPFTDMPVQKLRSKLTVLGSVGCLENEPHCWYWFFVEIILLLWNILPCNQLFACKASSTPLNSFFLTKQKIFNKLINLHAICILHIVQHIEVILLDPFYHTIHSIRLRKC